MSKKLVSTEINKLCDLSSQALEEIEKAVAVLDDLSSEYDTISRRPNLFEQRKMIENEIINGILPDKSQQPAFNWAYDYKLIFTKLDIIFDYVLSCRNKLNECQEVSDGNGAKAVDSEEARGAA